MEAQRLCRPLDEAAAKAVAALLVHALPRGGGSAALCAVARQPGARDRQGRRGGRRARQRQADGLCGKLYPRNRIGMSHGRVRGQAHDRWACRDDRRQEARRALRDQALHQIRLRVELRRWQPAAAEARHPVRSPRRQGASHQALRAIHENGGGQSRQRLEARGRRDRCLRPRSFATTMINPSGRSSMTLSRRSLLKSAAAVGGLDTSGRVFAPAIAENQPERLCIIRPRSRSTDNECEAIMSSLLAIKYWKGKFASVAGINPDYSYGRNNMAAFVAMLKRFNIEHKVVTEQWPKVGTMDLTSHVAALKAAKPDLIFSSLLFADLPVFMKQAHAAELTKDSNIGLPSTGWQHTLMKKEFTPEGILFGHNTFYFDNPNGSPLAKEFVAWYERTYKDYPEWEADRANSFFISVCCHPAAG